MNKLLLLFLFLLMIPPKIFSQSLTKLPNVAGGFYPENPKLLSAMLDSFFKKVESTPKKKVHMLIAPHAGYVYSGQVAAASYHFLHGQSYSTVVLIGPSHFFSFEGVAVWKEGSFKTPLGEISVDADLASAFLKDNPSIHIKPEVFEKEHALEVQLPFLQKTLSDFKIVPLLMGQPDPLVAKSLADTLVKNIGNREDVLVILSTDLSHYHDAVFAQQMDRKTLLAIKNLQAKDIFEQNLTRQMELCGFTAVVTGILYAKQLGITDVEILQYSHSGMVSGENDRVVGYSAVSFSKSNAAPSSENLKENKIQSNSLTQAKNAPHNNESQEKEKSSFSRDQKKILIQIAKETIHHYVRTKETLNLNETDPRLLKPEGAFVTIHKDKRLRGCIGHIIGDQPLYLTVRDMAIAAASSDPRFDPVTIEELSELEIEVSVLSVPEKITDVGLIEMGKHGVILGRGQHRGLFLPQVATETGWSREEFLSQLCSQKAGLPRDCFKDPQTEIQIFSADVFSEKDISVE